MRVCHRGFVIDDRVERFDFERVHAWLTASYWSPGILPSEVERGFRRSSFVAGAYSGLLQIGCLRLVTDFTRFAYLMDVVVAPEARGRGLGQALVRFALAHPELSLVYKWTLATADAHAVYERAGFHALAAPERWMSLERPRPWLAAGR
ncbi:MAG TPA: GNAT family N-acetyltransferase [Polyangiaceae bacterium]|nr:GNAT family N-acetyltransferase [Polyangiaceae bacterium]